MLKPLGLNNHRVHLKKIANYLQILAMLTQFAVGTSVDTSIRKKHSARQRDWDERLGVFESMNLGTTLSLFIAIEPSRRGVEFLRIIFKFQKENKVSSSLVYIPALKSKIRQFLVVVVQKRQRNVQSSEIHVQSCCFAYCHLFLFLTFSLP